MSVPIIMVCLIWQFTQIWNDFLFGVVFASSDAQPITVALNNWSIPAPGPRNTTSTWLRHDRRPLIPLVCIFAGSISCVG